MSLIEQPVPYDAYSSESLSEGGTAYLSYDPAEPFSVQILFAGGQTWEFSRSLLHEGLRNRSGDGDVRIVRYDKHIAVVLNSDDGFGVVMALAAPCERFLQATYRAVPPGSEVSDVDGLLEEIWKEHR